MDNNDLINDIMLRLCIYDNTPIKSPTTKTGKIIFGIVITVIVLLMAFATIYCLGYFD